MPTRSLRQVSSCSAGERRLVEGDFRRAGGRAVVAVRLGQQVVRHDDGRRPRLARGQLKRLPDAAGNVADLRGVEDAFGDLLNQAGLRDFMELKRFILVAAGHVADDADERHAVEQRLADAGEGVGDSRPRHDAKDAGPAGAAGDAVGHARGRIFVGDEQVVRGRGPSSRPRVHSPAPPGCRRRTARPRPAAPRPGRSGPVIGPATAPALVMRASASDGARATAAEAAPAATALRAVRRVMGSGMGPPGKGAASFLIGFSRFALHAENAGGIMQGSGVRSQGSCRVTPSSWPPPDARRASRRRKKKCSPTSTAGPSGCFAGIVPYAIGCVPVYPRRRRRGPGPFRRRDGRRPGPGRRRRDGALRVRGQRAGSDDFGGRFRRRSRRGEAVRGAGPDRRGVRPRRRDRGRAAGRARARHIKRDDGAGRVRPPSRATGFGSRNRRRCSAATGCSTPTRAAPRSAPGSPTTPSWSRRPAVRSISWRASAAT